jgi:glycogen synthase
MKILIVSRFFYPSLGGSETNAEILAREFTLLGNEVKVITQIPGNNLDINKLPFSFEVIRKPNFIKVINLVNWCEICFHNGINLRFLYPLLLIKKPWVIRHQIWLRHINGNLSGIGGTSNTPLVKFKHWITQFAVSISISKAIADHLKYPSYIIPNPYNNRLFRRLTEIKKTKELVFLGRLVSEKGVDMLLVSLTQLVNFGLQPQLTIIGDGPDKARLRQKTEEMGIAKQVVFVSSKVGEELVRILNEHHIMVVPSLYDEPFGVVALEGIACGCVIIGSQGGGLKDAIGSCGVTFPNGNVERLTQTLFDLLTHPEKMKSYRENAEAHLARHTSTAVAKVYLEVLEGVMK